MAEEISRLKVLGVILLGLAVCAAAMADSWPRAKVANVFSGDGRHFVRITPGRSIGETQGFAGAPKGEPASAEFFRSQADRSYGFISEAKLVNPVAPVDALVSSAGRLITFDNWHNAGYGRIVAIYDQDARLVAAYELEGLYPPERLARLPASVSSRWWRCPAFGYVDPGLETKVYVAEKLGGTFIFELASGAFEYLPGTATCD